MDELKWNDVYTQFNEIIDDVFQNHKNGEDYENIINTRIKELYASHKGEQAWDEAYIKFYENKGEF